ncbi:MAG: tocopherol cyclase family protein [Oscillospiraceae bacterium]|nr:tocopherol cyclase family protein [Oscillospiraceae bacterium]
MPKKEYFKGWYFKSCNKNQTVAFIPSLHCGDSKESAFLQIITDDNAFCLPFPKLKYREKPLFVKIGNGVFSEKGIKLDIKTDELTAQGTLRFGELSPIRYDIMGPFKFVPFMQCRHSVYSMSHRVVGRITINGKRYVFHNGAGYIEGDCGTSFPKRYVWTQCNFFNGSLMLSAADIPMLGFGFTGIIGVVMLNGKEHRIATYLGAKLKHVGNNTITVSQGAYELTAKLIVKNSHPLSAPVNGEMSRTIHESASCMAYYRFLYKGAILCEFTSDRASFEFEYR